MNDKRPPPPDHNLSYEHLAKCTSCKHTHIQEHDMSSRVDDISAQDEAERHTSYGVLVMAY